MNSNLYLSIEIITSFQFLFLAIFLLANSRGNGAGNKLFGLFLLGKGLTLAFNYILQNYFSELNSSVPFLLIFYYPLLFFYTPFLYLYAKSITEEKYKLNKGILLHLLPSAVVLIFSISVYSDDIIFRNPLAVYIDYIYYIQAITYTIFAIIVIVKFNSVLKEQFSSLEKLKLNWLVFLFSGFLFIWLVFLTESILYRILGSNLYYSNLLLSFGLLLLFIFSNSIAYRCLKHPQLFDKKFESNFNKPISLPKSVNNESARKLINLMETEKPYLNPELNLNQLAEKLEIHPRSLSLLIKHNFNKNFFDFINNYRIDEAKILLKSDNKMTILQILMESGFNSKSVFNTCFKKYTGLTPSQFKTNTNSNKNN